MKSLNLCNIRKKPLECIQVTEDFVHIETEHCYPFVLPIALLEDLGFVQCPPCFDPNFDLISRTRLKQMIMATIKPHFDYDQCYYAVKHCIDNVPSIFE